MKAKKKVGKKQTGKVPQGVTRMTAAEYRASVLDELPQFAALPGASTREKPQIRMPKQRGPNKVEAEWMARCVQVYAAYGLKLKIVHEPFSVRLPSGTRYTPDVGIFFENQILALWEVKGPYIHDKKGSIRALKEAAATWPQWNWSFAQKRESGWCQVSAREAAE